MTTTDVRVRTKVARAYLDVAILVAEEDEAHRQVAAGLASLAAIAAADAICGARLGERSADQDHARAGDLLATTAPDGTELARHFREVIRDKSNAHYGTTYLTHDRVVVMLRRAQHLVDALDALA
ncbi:hypothetical protein [Cellulomonas phragmiteti]|uniref:HEPN domain-containing protein n=1 Tax=Cellulomonas phragmiteti TaxID=478780 RepID=A0ABQ4DHE4_9CELL|nr:hypothetical protein [Cellulomonas phragmiteti]GIG38769.1 hypothetical protein Cph01nite_05310 [Cellulomonas phragmiteti]